MATPSPPLLPVSAEQDQYSGQRLPAPESWRNLLGEIKELCGQALLFGIEQLQKRRQEAGPAGAEESALKARRQVGQVSFLGLPRQRTADWRLQKRQKCAVPQC